MTQPSPAPGPRWWGGAVTVLTLGLALCRLGNGALWDDEAVTGLLGAHILKFGLPRVQDGALLVTFYPGDSRGGLWCWDGWVQAYLSAAGEALFGRTALGARFFHAVAGALIPWFAYPLFRDMTRRRHVAEAATLLTGLSVPLLIFARQAHYYTEATLISVLMVRAYRDVPESRRAAAVWLGGWAFLLFHTSYLALALMWLAILVHLLLLRPPLRVLVRIGAAGAVSSALAAPFALWARIWDRQFSTQGDTHTLYLFLARLRHYLLELNLHLAPLALLLLAGAVAAGKRRPLVAIACGLGFLLAPTALSGAHTPAMLALFAAMLFVAGALGFALVVPDALQGRSGDWRPGWFLTALCVTWLLGIGWIAPYPFLRYLTPIFPFLIFLVAASAFCITRGSAAGWVIVAVVLVCNGISVWPLDYALSPVTLRQIAGALPGAGRLEGSRLFGRTGLRDLDAAFYAEVWRPEAEPKLVLRFPLAEYSAVLTHSFRGPVDAIADHLNARKKPGDRFYTWSDAYPVAFSTGLAPLREVPLRLPRWVIPRISRPLSLGEARRMTKGLGYREIRLDAIDTYYQNREEPDLHRFRSEVSGDPVRLLERIQ